MAAETYILNSIDVKNNAIRRIQQINPDGNMQITISSAGRKSARQRALQWMWYTEVSRAGIGGKHEDSKEGVHLVSRYRFAVPILCRDDPTFAELWAELKKRYKHDSEKMMWITDNFVHTESFNMSQMAEYLTEFEHFYGPMVALTDPEDLLYVQDNEKREG